MRNPIERTLVLIKPDAVLRGVSGEIIRRFEKVGLKLIALKLINAKREQLDMHFPINDLEWIAGMGRKSLETYKKHGLDPMQELNTDDSFEIGKIILEWNYEYLLSGPLMALILEGPRAISVVRKIIGHTIPSEATPGTIRGDFSVNSADYANANKVSCKNVVHASGNFEEAQNECRVWFSEEEIVNYSRVDETVMYKKI